MTLQRRHFELIAEIVRDLSEASDTSKIYKERVAVHFANRLAATNPKFNKERFIRACQHTR